ILIVFIFALFFLGLLRLRRLSRTQEWHSILRSCSRCRRRKAGLIDKGKTQLSIRILIVVLQNLLVAPAVFRQRVGTMLAQTARAVARTAAGKDPVAAVFFDVENTGSRETQHLRKGDTVDFFGAPLAAHYLNRVSVQVCIPALDRYTDDAANSSKSFK